MFFDLPILETRAEFLQEISFVFWEVWSQENRFRDKLTFSYMNAFYTKKTEIFSGCKKSVTWISLFICPEGIASKK